MQHIIQLTLPMSSGFSETFIHPIVLQDAENLILVDCGYVGCLGMLEAELKRHGITFDQLTGLVLTHHDHDHMGTAAALKRANPRMLVYASSKEAVYISAKEKPLRLVQAEKLQETLPIEQQAFGEMFCSMLRRIEPVEVDVLLSEAQLLPWCGGTQVLLTAGHTPGHISLFVPSACAVIVGDAFALEDNLPVLANPQFTLDMQLANQSIQKLLSLKARTYYCYHGGIFLS